MILKKGKIEFQLKCQNPFVATMYHVDHFPLGNGKLGPAVTKPYNEDGDFGSADDWHMYYGKDVPGFPAHPHRGFETVTVVLQGVVDHTDGLGSAGRYADGDVQWMTAGKGLQHAEMFPLLKTQAPNTLELFQIWLSLDHAHRMTEPFFKMLWREDIPIVTITDEKGHKAKVIVIAGQVNGQSAPPPTPASWANVPANHLSIQIIEMEPGAQYTIPAVSNTLNRSVYFYQGSRLQAADTTLDHREYVFAVGGEDLIIRNSGQDTAKILLLEAEPIPEPIVLHGPFVMSSEHEIREAYADFRETEFGGWPFATEEVYHRPEQQRFAKYADGHTEYPQSR